MTMTDDSSVARFRASEMACPLDARYYATDPDFMSALAPYVSEEASIAYQMRVEIALAEVLAEHQVAPFSFPEDVARACQGITVEEVYREEARIGHVVRALVNCIRARLPEASRPFVHLFATSNDITDSATALRLRELTRDVVLPRLIDLESALVRTARLHAHTAQIGRTHGKYAEPITFGYFLANYASRIGNRVEAIESARQNLRGKLSGAVGAYNALALRFRDPAAIEKAVLGKLGLAPVDTQVSTQIVHPEYVADLMHAVVSAFSVLANLADDIRHLHRSEIDEAQEIYDEARVGSSTMPHKLNPKNFEFVKSLWKAFMPRMTTVYLDQISEHQRDLTNSASSRFLTELLTAFVYATHRLRAAMQNLDVREPSIARNLAEAKGEMLAEPLYILLSLNGHPDGHTVARRLVARARATGEPLSRLVQQEEGLRPYLAALTDEQRAVLDDAARYTGRAAERTEAACDHWEVRCEQLQRALAAEARDARRPGAKAPLRG
jgi:adenylosuccinate lyase